MVPITEIASEPRQPSRFEKNANTSPDRAPDGLWPPRWPMLPRAVVVVSRLDRGEKLAGLGRLDEKCGSATAQRLGA